MSSRCSQQDALVSTLHSLFSSGGKTQITFRAVDFDQSSPCSIIGLAYPLYNAFLPLYLSDRLPSGSTNQTYRDYTIASVMGIPGSAIACILVDWTRKSKSGFSIGGRKMALAVSTAATGMFLYLFTTAQGEASNLGFTCASTLTQ